MGRVTVTNNVSLDGVMQAPGRADEDTRGGFDRGGWALPYMDETLGAEMGRGMSRAGVMLFGRRTYQDFASFWPHQTDGNPFTAMMDRVQKYVVSRDPGLQLEWQNSTLLSGAATDTVRALKDEVEGDISILGSGELVTALRRAKLIDEYWVLIHPVLLGSGRRLFPEGRPETFELIRSVTTTTGVILAAYRPTEEK